MQDRPWSFVSIWAGGLALTLSALGFLGFALMRYVELPLSPFPQFILFGCGLALIPVGLLAAAVGAVRRERFGVVLIGAGLSLAALIPPIVAVIVGLHAVATT